MKYLIAIYDKRRELMEAANSKQITLSIGKRKYPAKVAGTKLEYPFIWATHQDGHTIDLQVSWEMVEKLATGKTTNVVLH